MFLTWFFTVFSEMNSSLAMSRLFRPRATRRRTYISRSVSLGAWDVIGISAADVVLIQVKSNQWPCSEEMEQLRMFRAPANTRKLIHRWCDRARLPDTKQL